MMRVSMLAASPILLASAGLLMSSGAVSAAVIPLTPADTGQSVGSSNTGGAFDAQPVTDPVAGPTSVSGGAAPTFYVTSGRSAYIDFGANFAVTSITGTFELYKVSGTNSTGQALNYTWSDATKVANATHTAAAPDFGFQDPTTADGPEQWVTRYTGPAVTPVYRYLILAQTGNGTTNRSLEWVFVSNPVPEPASLALLGVGGLLMLPRHKRRA